MKRKILFLVFILLVITGKSYGQKIKFRLDIGNCIHFQSYSPYLFTKNHKYHQPPIPTSEYVYKKLPTYSLWREFPTKIGFSLELDIKQRNHFTFEYKRGEGFSLSNRVIYNYAWYKDSLGHKVTAPWHSTEEIQVPLNKISFTYSRDYGKGIVRFSPLIGIGYAWIEDAKPFEKLHVSRSNRDKDDLFPSSVFNITFIDNLYANTNTFMGSLGINFRFHSKKRELLALKLYYEQGFRAIAYNQVIVHRNNKAFTHNFSYSYGSAFYVKLSIPIPIYDFEKHREK